MKSVTVPLELQLTFVWLPGVPGNKLLIQKINQ
jgi:hypothetical protein